MRTSVELLIIEALLVVSGLVSTVAQAQFNYVAVGGIIIITGYAGPGGEVTVPPTINGLPVTVIGSGAFYNSVTLTGVTLPSSVTSLYSGAFSRCTRLANFTIPRGVTNSDQEVFSYCTNLTTIAPNWASN